MTPHYKPDESITGTEQGIQTTNHGITFSKPFWWLMEKLFLLYIENTSCCIACKVVMLHNLDLNLADRILLDIAFQFKRPHFVVVLSTVWPWIRLCLHLSS